MGYLACGNWILGRWYVMRLRDNATYIREKIPEVDILEQLAEESSELTHAALKLARIKRGINPSPISETQAMENLVEELSDLILITRFVLDIEPDKEVINQKMKRWKNRIENSRSKQVSD